MPEVCEVCLTTQYLHSIIGSFIIDIDVINGRYKNHVMKGLDDLKFPLRVDEIDSKGKFMWMTLSHNNEKWYMMNTFGLSGKWSIDEQLDYVSVSFTLKHENTKHKLYFGDVRNFGTIEFTKDIKKLDKKIEKLAPDFLKSPLKNFKTLVRNYPHQSYKIVKVLMNQNISDGLGSGLGSGLGNYLVPEILYRSKLSPHRPISSLSDEDIIHLKKSIKHILGLCYINNTTPYISHLKNFIVQHKKGVTLEKYPSYHHVISDEPFTFSVYRQKTDPHGNEVIGQKIITGRTTYWCPSVQK